MREKDAQDQKITELQTRRIQQLYRQVQRITHQIVEFRISTAEDIAYYSFEKDFLMKTYFTFQRKIMHGN